MDRITPCYRHPRGTWLANCATCTTWHLAEALTGRVGTTAGHVGTTAGPDQPCRDVRAVPLPRVPLLQPARLRLAA